MAQKKRKIRCGNVDVAKALTLKLKLQRIKKHINRLVNQKAAKAKREGDKARCIKFDIEAMKAYNRLSGKNYYKTTIETYRWLWDEIPPDV